MAAKARDTAGPGLRTVLASLALAAMVAIPAPSLAQDFLTPYLDSQRYDNLRRHQQRIQQQRRAGQQAPASLSQHQRACAQRYRSYDPRTDLYVVRPGVTARCRL
ncbi:BA14K family protein [Inquilinus limosus]|uniref:Lectin-like protein BA14k n=1 Tax=Inquilinus limosus TaxID=171674 RepID=A0A211ZI61_9PROT|nr:BA14K family protein [Inquilinus limosus]OWJ64876.1 hypothetical protein BWR60_22205 [Inquilinus limosus]